MSEESDLLISAAYSDARLARDAQKIIAHAEKTGKQIGKAMQDGVDKVADGQVFKAQAREIESLKRRYDPLYAASKKYERELDKLNRAHAVGAINTKQHAAALDRLNKTLAPPELDRAVASTKNYGGALQQVGFQVGDFATQVGGGTSAVQALGQQLPQLLGAFGAFGAVAGAGAAIMIPLGAALYKMATDSVSLEDSMKDLSKATDAYVSAADAATTPIEDLRAKFGDLADEVERVNDLTMQLTGASARAALSSSTTAFSEQFGGLSATRRVELPGMYNSKTISELENTTQKLRREFDLSEDEARKLATALVALNDAAKSGPDAVASAGANMQQSLIDIAGGADQAAKKFSSLFDGEEGLPAIISAATSQIEASVSDQERAQQDLIERYRTTTEDLKSLVNDRAVAERAQADAVKRGLVAEADLWADRIRMIDRNIDKTRQLANESDVAFQRMAAAYQNYAQSRVEGDQWASSRSGFEAQYVAERASGAGSANEELVRAVTALSEQLGVSAKDILAAMSFETGGKLRPDVTGPTTQWGQHFGLIQFGQPQGQKYGVTTESSITEQVIAAGKYLEDAGVKAGDSLANVYAAILAGDARKVSASDIANGGVVDNVSEAVSDDQFAPHIARAEALLAAYGGVQAEVRDGIKATEEAEKKAASERQKALREENRERERKLELVEQYGEKLQAQLIDEKKEAELSAELARRTAEINASGMSASDKAAAIAAVNAELERQRLIYQLLAEAKQRDVDLDAQMVGSTQTYRQAIEALGDVKRQEIILDQQRTAAIKDTAEAQAFYNGLQDQAKQGLIDAIIAGESFEDVLKKIALQFAQAALQASLFGDGPLSNIFGGGGLFGGSNGGGIISAIGNIFGGARASGGPVSAGTPYLVNENTPNSEIFVPSVSGAILNTSQAQAALRGAASARGGNMSFAPSTSIVIQGNADERTIDTMRRELAASNAAMERRIPSIMRRHNLMDG